MNNQAFDSQQQSHGVHNDDAVQARSHFQRDQFAFARNYIKHDHSKSGAYKFIDLRDVTERVSLWKACVPSAELIYDLGSEANPYLLQHLNRKQIHFSAASASQLERLQVLGVDGERVVFTPSFPTRTAAAQTLDLKPDYVTIGSEASLATLLEEVRASKTEYRPTLNILVRIGEQPYQNPLKIERLVQEAKQAGFTSFGIAVHVNHDEGNLASYEAAAKGLTTAAEQLVRAGVSINSLQILGGLIDSGTLEAERGQGIAEYLVGLEQILCSLKSNVQKLNQGVPVALQVEAGQVVIGHVPIISHVVNVVSSSSTIPRAAFIESHCYGDLAGHMFAESPVRVEAVQDPLKSTPLSERLLPTYIQGGSCDSVDAVKRGGELQAFPLPADLTTGCYLALYGSRLDHGAMDFNLIPPAKVVVVSEASAEAVPTECLELGEYHQPFFDRTRAWLASKEAAAIREYVRSVRETAPAKSLDKRREIMDRAAQAALNEFPNLSESFVLLDLGEYVGRLRQVENFLRYMPSFTKAEDAEAYLAGRLEVPRPERPTGVDHLLIPLKTLNDPTALVVLTEMGHGYDAASSAEVAMAKMTGVDLAHDVIVSHPHKTRQTLDDIVASRPWATTIDSESELNRLILSGASRDMVLFVRIKATGIGVKNDLSSKFGTLYSRSQGVDGATPLLRAAHAAGFKQLGIAFHVGTQCADGMSYRNALDRALSITTSLKEGPDPIEIAHFNIGGGFCDERVASVHGVLQRNVLAQTCAQVNRFRRKVEKELGRRVTIVAEPGRVTCAAAGATVVPVAEVYYDQNTFCRVRILTTWQASLSGNVHDDAFYELRSLTSAPTGRNYGTIDVLGVSGRQQDRFVPAPGTHHDIDIATKRGDWVISYESGAAYGVNAAGAVNGIDPGGVIAFIEDPQSPTGFRFFKSPLFNREEIINDAIREKLSVAS